MPTNEGFSGVSNCYVFKSRLQEYAQKVGLPTPVYETIKEGPSHEPFFRSTVIVNDVRYDSLPGFFNRKAAEQSAAEVALMEIAKSSEVKEGISQPVHETGLCKNLLQEYAQKMNYAIPLYECQKDETPGRVTQFSCTVEIGGIRYIGAAARTKKEAEIKAARTALLAIQSSTSESSGLLGGNSQLTVIPGKKREIESVKNPEEARKALKPKKARFKKKMAKKRTMGDVSGDIVTGIPVSNMSGLVGLQVSQTVHAGVQVASGVPLDMEYMMNPTNEMSNVYPSWGEVSGVESALIPHTNGELQDGQSMASNVGQSTSNMALIPLTTGETPSMPYGDLTVSVNEVNKAGEVASNNAAIGQMEIPSVMAGMNQSGESIQAGAD